jgi:hypothetical protein
MRNSALGIGVGVILIGAAFAAWRHFREGPGEFVLRRLTSDAGLDYATYLGISGWTVCSGRKAQAATGAIGLTVAPGKLIFSAAEFAGNLWILQ